MKNETNTLKVHPFVPPPDKKRISFRLPVPTLDAFDSYLAAYAEIYGVKPDPDFIADQIFTSFFESDRAFAAYLRKGPEPKESGAKKGRKTLLGVENATLGETAQI